MTAEFITLTEMDYNRINNLIEQRQTYPFLTKEISDLSEEVERARVIETSDIPSDLVTMNSRFRYLNVTDDKESEMTLVYPHGADSSAGRISVTAPLGMALLGLREGEEVEWTFPDGARKKLRVLEILYQPEAEGDLG